MFEDRLPALMPALPRRDFLKGIGITGTLTALGAWSLPGAYAAPTRGSRAETLAQELFEKLTSEQRQVICLPFEHASRTKVNPNWAITQPAIHEEFYTPVQRDLAGKIFQAATSESGHGRFLEQMEFDDGGFDRYHMAFFGTPEAGPFEWVVTGRHLTFRADGNSTAGMAFGGPVVYGHGEENAADNLFHSQTQQANEVFQALNADQRRIALLTTPPTETAVQLQGAQSRFPGISGQALTSDQQALLAQVLQHLLSPYREEDIAEVMECVNAGGGIAGLSMAFYQKGDLNNDQEWDIWRIEGPTFVCHFRGAPHVHAYLHVGQKA